MTTRLQCKRLYIEPFTWTCPVCSADHVFDSYLSYPSFDVPEDITGYCTHDYTEFANADEFEDVIATATITCVVEMREHK